MDELLTISLAFPTVIWTALLGVASCFWLLSMVGAVDAEAFDGGAEAAGEAAAEAVAEAAAEAGAEASAEAGGQGLDGIMLLSLLGRRSAPITIKLSLLFALGWFLSAVASFYLGDALGALMPAAAWGAAVFVASALVGVPVTAGLLLPLDPLFVTHEAVSRKDLIGRVVSVQTGRVDQNFGQGILDDGEAGMVLQVRCDTGTLSRGDQALILSYDEERDAYEVEAYERLLKS